MRGAVGWRVGCAAALLACGGADEARTNATVYEHVRIITGNPEDPIEDGILVVEDGRIIEVGPAGEFAALEGARRVDLSGKTVMPALVNAHVHLSSDADARTDQLRRMAYYGAGTVLSLGHDSGSVPAAARDAPAVGGARALTAGRGITSPEPGRSEVPHWVTTEEEARAAVRDLVTQNVDFVKIWVDDRGGQYEKLAPELYQAVIDEAHAQRLKVAAHVFALADAKGLLRAGIDAFAHGIRDRDIDDELVALWHERPGVVLIPNLPDPGVARDLSWLGETVPAERVAEMQAAATDRPDAQEFFGIQARNLARLSEAGIPIAFGTDGSDPWQVHLEMEDMVRAGLTPAQVIVAATRTSAELLGVPDVGVLEPGRSADFIVLDGNPLTDITNTRSIDAVYLRGAGVDRDALRVQAAPDSTP